MEHKTDIMISLAVALGTNCIPCFDHLYSKAKESGIEDHEIKRIVEIADKVKNGTAIFLKQAIRENLGEPSEALQPCSGQQECRCC